MFILFKFGGASVKDADSVRNMLNIVKSYKDSKIIIVISAMGKMTNAFEVLLKHYFNNEPTPLAEAYNNIYEYHKNILDNLFSKSNKVFAVIKEQFENIKKKLATPPSNNYDFEYAQIVAYGEILSTLIIHHYFLLNKSSSEWLDIRNVIKSDNTFREAKVFWANTESKAQKTFKDSFSKGVNYVITQGFIASTRQGYTTTLGREGSDYTASIIAYCLNVKEITIWKDVSGFLNADPKFFKDTVKLDYISYRDAIELSYYGASIIHPKTIKPLQNKNIKLNVKSFLDPSAQGSVISETFNEMNVPCYICKPSQTLISIYANDFAFINEKNMQYIFQIINKYGLKINMMQNSAISFSLCTDTNLNIPKLINVLSKKFTIKFNDNLILYTIKYYNDSIIEKLIAQRKVFLEQKTRNTIQLLIN